ncbi:hypothetical protein Gotri_025495 [Gossypium trilobum]|uniref:Uncharacterized protein n=1 Tax=Gossypium trilobum TaxID=34281 RepID=A0A7J9FWU4_9ROSI|nr:hypothetical protein [Gossypium trilobum]
MEKRMVDLSIEDGEEAWLLPGEVKYQKSVYEFCLVGCFFTASVAHFLAVRNTMTNLWHTLGEVQILNLGKKEDEDPMQVPLVFSSFRILVHDLPLGFFSGFVAK